MVLRSPFIFLSFFLTSAYSSNKSEKEDDSSSFRPFTEEDFGEECIGALYVQLFTILKSSLVSFLLLAASASTQVCSILLILSFTSAISPSSVIILHV